MPISARKFSIVIAALFIMFTILNIVPANAAVVPVVDYAVKPQLEYTAGDRVQFNLYAPSYGGRVQYRVVLWNNEKKSYRDLWTTGDRYYTNWQPYGNNIFTLGWPISEPGTYRITIYAKRAGIPNNRTALRKMNCDSYMESAPFVVKPVTDENYEKAIKAVAAYEAAPLATQAQITAAEGLKTAAIAAVETIGDNAIKGGLTSRINAKNTKLEAAKYAVNYLNVVKVTPLSFKKIKVEFDKEIAQPVKDNFKITEKSNELIKLNIDTITVDKNSVVVSLLDEGEGDTNYIIRINGVKALKDSAAQKEAYTEGFNFSFEKNRAAKIEFKSRTLIYDKVDSHKSDSLQFVIKDMYGNDISDSYSFAKDMNKPRAGEVVVELDDESFFDEGYTAHAAGVAIVNMYIKGSDPIIETGNTIITIKDKADQVLTSIGKFTVARNAPNSFDKINTSLFCSDSGYFIYPQLLNEENSDYEGNQEVTLEYKSYDNSILLVNTTSGEITPVSIGTASVLVTAKVHDHSGRIAARASKTIQIEVKADPKAATLKVDTTSLKLTTPVEGHEAVSGTIKVQLLDQYGGAFLGDGEVGIKVNQYLNDSDKEIIQNLAESLTLVYDEHSDDYASAKLKVIPAAEGSLKITVSHGKLSRSITVTVVEAGEKAGYAAEINSTKLDLYEDNKSGTPNTAEIKVFAKDTKGNRIYEVNDFNLSYDPDQTVFTDNQNGTLTAKKKGKENVVIKVGTTRCASYTIEVIDSTPVLTSVTQAKDVIVYDLDGGTSLVDLLFGKFSSEDGSLLNADKAALIIKDQHGDAYRVSDEDVSIKIRKTDGTLTRCGLSDLSVGTDIGEKAIVTIIINDKVYVVEVYVK